MPDARERASALWEQTLLPLDAGKRALAVAAADGVAALLPPGLPGDPEFAGQNRKP
jgi:hypothetical protein